MEGDDWYALLYNAIQWSVMTGWIMNSAYTIQSMHMLNLLHNAILYILLFALYNYNNINIGGSVLYIVCIPNTTELEDQNIFIIVYNYYKNSTLIIARYRYLQTIL